MNFSPDNFTIRSAALRDAHVLARIAKAAYQMYLPLMDRMPAPMEADYSAHIGDDACFVVEVEVENSSKIIGFAVLMEKLDGWWLETIATDPSAQGRGVGRAIMAYVEAWLVQRTDRYFLYTNVAMTAPYNWYLQQGFVVTGRATQDGFARIFMSKELNLACKPDSQ